MSNRLFVVVAVFLAGLLYALLRLQQAQAAEVKVPCPPKVLSCKVVVMTPQEVQSLEGPGLIFDSAEWANRANLSAAVAAWKRKIAASPQGIPDSAEKKGPAAKKP